MAYIYTPNRPYFITQKTFSETQYFKTDEDKQLILNEIIKFSHTDKFHISAFAILSNHLHLLGECAEPNGFQTMLKQINGAASRNFNLKHGTTHTIWTADGRYNRALYGEHAFFKVMAYIIGNPLKHGLVKSLNELANYPFCSYNEAVKEYNKPMIENLILETLKLDFETSAAWDRIWASIDQK